MELELIDVSLKSFKAVAVRITEGNMNDVAAWCSGVVHTTRLSKELSDVRYIEVTTWAGKRITKRQFAFRDHWIVRSSGRYTVYKHSSFMGTFNRDDQKHLELAHKQGQVLGLVISIMSSAQSYMIPLESDQYLVAKEYADKIMKLFGEEPR